MAIEIRVLDMQECPRADLAIAAVTTAAVRAFVENRWVSFESQTHWPVDRLADILRSVVRDGEHARIRDHGFLEAFGMRGNRDRTTQEVWQSLASRLVFGTPSAPVWCEALDVILERGPRGRRIVHALNGDHSRDPLVNVCRRLCDCLETGVLFAWVDSKRDSGPGARSAVHDAA